MRKTKYRVQLVLPQWYKKLAYEELHDKMGHLNAERVIQLEQERIYWPYLTNDLQHYVQKVCQCLKQKKPNREQRAPLMNIKTSEPFELISIDYLHLDRCKGGYEYMWVGVDHFKRYVQVYPTRNKDGRTAADKFLMTIFCDLGFLGRYIMTKEENLQTIYSKGYMRYVVWRHPGHHRIIHKVTAK